jgi:hypothetical protein
MEGIIEDVARISMLQDLDFTLSNDFNKIYTLLKRMHGERLTVNNVLRSINKIGFLQNPIKNSASKPVDLNFYKENLLVSNLLLRVGNVDVGDLDKSKYSVKYITAPGMLSEFYESTMSTVLWHETSDIDNRNFIQRIRFDIEDETRIHLLKLCSEYSTEDSIGCSFEYHSYFTKQRKRSKVKAVKTFQRHDPSYSFFFGIALGNIQRAGTIERIAEWTLSYIDGKYFGQNPNDIDVRDITLRQVANKILTHSISVLGNDPSHIRHMTSTVARIIQKILQNTIWWGSATPYSFSGDESGTTKMLTSALKYLSKKAELDSYAKEQIMAIGPKVSHNTCLSSVREMLQLLIAEISSDPIQYVLDVCSTESPSYNATSSMKEKLEEIVKKALAGDWTERDRLVRKLDECIAARFQFAIRSYSTKFDAVHGDAVLRLLNTHHYLLRSKL